MKNKNTPPIKILLTSEHFNALISVLKQFAETPTETFYSRTSDKLIEKIFHYGRAYSTQKNDNAVINFFPEEASALIEILVIFSGIFLSQNKNYYADFKNIYEQKKKL